MVAGGGLMDANTDTLARAAQMAAVVVQEIEGHRKNLDGQVNSVIPGQWNMDQSTALLNAYKKWETAIRNLCGKLEKLGGDTMYAMNDYADVDQQGAACFNGVDGGGSDGGGDHGGGSSGGSGDSDDGDGDGKSAELAGGSPSSLFAFGGLLRT
ncbi:WXG100 family type VII secretion target [Amycolatopsis marina]|uniref:WXG100 family type VII secretion target n=2 Tax=Amycolatopsis marina TaxID=490629 RepID=A0A1I1AH76_9PSEU|nr:WXG100 family type VII secretion target [Amycolatopsis marina]SFB35838.1 WXG100 family type VII secretion target [Amycolatopsis marina]